MSTHQLPLPARLTAARAARADAAAREPAGRARSGAAIRDPGSARTVAAGVAAVVLLAGLVGGVVSLLAWAAARGLLLLLA